MIDKNQVLEIYGSLEQHYSRMHSQMLAEDAIFNRDFDKTLDIPYRVSVVKSSTGANIVEDYRNQIRTDKPTVVFRAVGRSEAAEKKALLMQRWGYGQLKKEREVSTYDPTLQCGMHLLLRGAACKKITVDVDSLAGKPPRKGSAMHDEWEDKAMTAWPFVVRTIDPMAVYPSPDDRRPLDYIVEKQMRTAGAVKRAYPNWQDPDYKRNPARKVEWLEYWSDEQYVVLADKEEVINKPNPYGFVPYIFEWSGLGRVHYSNDPMYLSEGVLTTIAGELEDEVRLRTSASVQTQMHVFPPILTIDDPQTVAQQFGVGPGKVIQHTPQNPPEYMKFPPPNENLFRNLEIAYANISRRSSPALSGGRSPGVSYGVQQAQMIGQALKSISPIVSTLDRIGTQTLNMMARMAKKLDVHQVLEGTQEDGPRYFTTGPKDFSHYNFDVTFEVVDPAENDRSLLTGMGLFRGGALSKRTLWEKYAKHVIEDADEEEMRMLEDSVFQWMVQTGMIAQAALQPEVFGEQHGEPQDGGGDGTQNRRTETVPIEAQLRTTELEQLGGGPGSLNVPREVAQAGFANATAGVSPAGGPPTP